MRVLVTGAAGYIGSCVAETLRDAGHAVTGFDSLKYGEGGAVPRGIKFIRGELTNLNLPDCALDAVVHLAGESWIPLSLQDPGLFYRVNVSDAIHLLDVMRAVGIDKFIWSSTSSVYAESAIPHVETDPRTPVSPYGSSKLAFEDAVKWYGVAHGLRAVTFRYFNVCGATPTCWERPYHRDRIIPKAIQAARERKAFYLYGTDYGTADGTCVRDYVHVADVAFAHLLALENIDRVAGETFNLGIGRSYSNREVVEAVESLVGRSIKVIDSPRRPGDPAILTCAANKAEDLLRWAPECTCLNEMIDSVVRYMPDEEAA